MRHHPKRFENISKYPPTAKTLEDVGALNGPIAELVAKSRKFYKEAFLTMFDLAVKHVWLEHQYTYKGVSRTMQPGGGIMPDKIYGYFMKHIVGVSQKPLSDSLFTTALISYLPDWFPQFYDHDPFTEPQYYKFPYKHVSIDHISFVYQCRERLEMLEHAERTSMTYGDFRDWAINHVNCEDPGQYHQVFWHNSSYLRRVKTKGPYKTKI